LISSDIPIISLTSGVSGILPLANGGTGSSTVYTQGSIIFAGPSGILSQDNGNLYWDDINNRLGISSGPPSFQFQVTGGSTSNRPYTNSRGTAQSACQLITNNTASFAGSNTNSNVVIDATVALTTNSANTISALTTLCTLPSSLGTSLSSVNIVGETVYASNLAPIATSSLTAAAFTASNNNASATCTNINGVTIGVQNSGIATNSTGLSISAPTITSPGTSTFAFGLSIASQYNTAGASSTTGNYTADGIFLGVPSQSGNTSGTTLNIGLNIYGSGGTPGIGGIILNYAIYCQSTAVSYFAGRIGIGLGNNTPGYPIDCAGNIASSAVGSGIRVAEGTNAKQGIAVLGAGGLITVSNSSVTTNSRIFLTTQIPGGVVGSVYISARVVGTSFTIKSSSAVDTSTVAYEIFEPS